MSNQTIISTLYAMRNRVPDAIMCIDDAIVCIRSGRRDSALDCMKALIGRPMPETIQRNVVQIRVALVAASGAK